MKSAHFLVVLGVLSCPLGACAPPASPAGGVPPSSRIAAAAPDPVDGAAASLADEWGVEVVSLQRTAVGALIDFRYRVLDAEKARPLMDHRLEPHLLLHDSETQLIVPTSRLGAMRQTNRSAEPTVGRTYFALFGNPAGGIVAGDVVDVVIGDFVAADLIVK